jgi:3-deoxy-7-phosphoheptulonate synthase
MRTAEFLVGQGVRLMRGGAYKLGAAPIPFRAWGGKGCGCWPSAGRDGIAIVTEVLDIENVDYIEETADVLQIGTRNMQNTALLRRVAKSNKPVLLKRGMAATHEEWLMAAEYVVSGGNPNVILCERGVRSSDQARTTLDLTAVPVMKSLSHLPIIIDPSHGTGKADYVPAMSRAALAAGADGLLVEVHPDPGRALSDGSQSLTFEAFAAMYASLKPLAAALNVKLL